MTIKYFTIASLALLVSLPSTASAADYKWVNTLKEFSAAVVDKSITGQGVRLKIHADGTMTGTAPRGKVKATWRWQFGFWCRVGTIGSEILADDCVQVWIKGNNLRIVRNRGFGEAVEYHLR